MCRLCPGPHLKNLGLSRQSLIPADIKMIIAIWSGFTQRFPIVQLSKQLICSRSRSEDLTKMFSVGVIWLG